MFHIWRLCIDGSLKRCDFRDDYVGYGWVRHTIMYASTCYVLAVPVSQADKDNNKRAINHSLIDVWNSSSYGAKPVGTQVRQAIKNLLDARHLLICMCVDESHSVWAKTLLYSKCSAGQQIVAAFSRDKVVEHKGKPQPKGFHLDFEHGTGLSSKVLNSLLSCSRTPLVLWDTVGLIHY